jgi:hypothetical protein
MCTKCVPNVYTYLRVTNSWSITSSLLLVCAERVPNVYLMSTLYLTTSRLLVTRYLLLTQEHALR